MYRTSPSRITLHVSRRVYILQCAYHCPLQSAHQRCQQQKPHRTPGLAMAFGGKHPSRSPSNISRWFLWRLGGEHWGSEQDIHGGLASYPGERRQDNKGRQHACPSKQHRFPVKIQLTAVVPTIRRGGVPHRINDFLPSNTRKPPARAARSLTYTMDRPRYLRSHSYSRDTDSHPPRDRTTEWVAAQDGQTYDSLPPSPTTAAAAMSMRAPRPSSNRTTASEQSLATTSTNLSGASVAPTRRRRASERHAPPPHTSPVTNFGGGVPPASYSARDQVRMPFPQSPPGSGYPLMLEVVPPRTEPDRSSSKVCAMTLGFGLFAYAFAACAAVSCEETQAISDRPDQGDWGAEHTVEERRQSKISDLLRLAAPIAGRIRGLWAAGRWRIVVWNVLRSLVFIFSTVIVLLAWTDVIWVRNCSIKFFWLACGGLWIPAGSFIPSHSVRTSQTVGFHSEIVVYSVFSISSWLTALPPLRFQTSWQHFLAQSERHAVLVAEQAGLLAVADVV